MITFSAFVLAACAKGLVGIEDPVEIEAMRDQTLGVDSPGAHGVEQQRRADGVDQPRGDDSAKRRRCSSRPPVSVELGVGGAVGSESTQARTSASR